MIHKALSLVTDQLNAYIRLHLRVNEDRVVLAALAQPDGSPGYPGENVIVATLVNIQEEKIPSPAPPIRSSREGFSPNPTRRCASTSTCCWRPTSRCTPRR